MGGVRFRISALISKQISDFWTQISADFNWFYHSVYEISTVASPSRSTHFLRYLAGVATFCTLNSRRIKRSKSLGTERSSDQGRFSPTKRGGLCFMVSRVLCGRALCKSSQSDSAFCCCWIDCVPAVYETCCECRCLSVDRSARLHVLTLSQL